MKPRACRRCGDDISLMHHNRRYCSDECLAANDADRRKAPDMLDVNASIQRTVRARRKAAGICQYAWSHGPATRGVYCTACAEALKGRVETRDRRLGGLGKLAAYSDEPRRAA